MSSNTDEILQILKDIETTYSYSVYIPSLQKEINFKQLTTEQLKTLYKTTVNKAILNLEFNTNFNCIIKENCLDTDIDINKLTIYDKIFIFIKTRIECLSPDIKFYLNEDEKNELNTTDNTVVISILDHFNNFVDKKILFQKQTYTLNQCSIDCDIPILEVENKFQKELTDATLADTKTDQLAEIVGDTFVNEITKFIVFLKIDNTEINLKETDFKNRLDIVKALPANLIKNVLEYIENYKLKINDLLSVKIDVNGQIITKEIPLDASFYNV
jgi:hypothetical protein